jgi:acetyl-CoA C-acetyltransferase
MKYRLPVIVGVGQVTDRTDGWGDDSHPLALARNAAEEAARDAGCPKILGKADAVSVVNIFSWNYGDPAGLFCEMLGSNPGIKEYTHIGGNTPQWLLNRTADRIAKGEIDIAVLAGAEAMHSLVAASKKGAVPSWPQIGGAPVVMAGDGRMGSNAVEMAHNAILPIQIYPLFENALRAYRGLSFEEHRAFLGTFCAGFSKIAAANPLAWFRIERSPEEIVAVTPSNKMIGYPYTKLMNPIMNVNQAAAVIMASEETADRLSVPMEKRVYIHGGADASDKWFVSERVSFTDSPAIRAVSGSALGMAGISLGHVDFFDLYSCFPCASYIGAKSIGLDTSNLPELTLTGGLACFGGAGNNYTMHAIAHAVDKLRLHPEQYGLVTGLGWFMTKHSAGLYSGIRPEKPWSRDGLKDIQAMVDSEKSPNLSEKPNGKAVVETYTVIHDRDGKPGQALVVVRLDDGSRCWAITEKDPALMASMESEEFIGKTGYVKPGDNTPNTIGFS